jgi:light-regulated signal transduction histidine kinase (bacteriophytochrome)
VRCKDGSVKTVQMDNIVTRDGIVGTLVDMTDLEQAQSRLDRLAAKMTEYNRELDQFVHAASHDLQEPLRAVAGFAQLMQQQYTGRIDDRADEYLTFIIDGATRMQRLIRDVLAVARVGSDDAAVDAVDVTDVVRDIEVTMQEEIAQADGTLRLDGGAVVAAHREHVRQLFHRLLDNCVRFRSDKPLRVSITCSLRSSPDAPPVWEFVVADNGIGIGPEYHRRVFEMFQRLHPRDRRYSGNGIGLAMVRKIVEHYDGTVRLTSGEKVGTTVRFSLPAAVDAEGRPLCPDA